MKTDLLYENKSYYIIGLCMDILNELGKRFSEIVYGDALELELKSHGIPYQREIEYSIDYKGNTLPHYCIADCVIQGKII